MQLFFIEFNDGFRGRDDVVVLDENEPLEPQAAAHIRWLAGLDSGDDSLYEVGEIYPLHAATTDGQEYAISLTATTVGGQA